jgi:hypothetical protein
MTPSPFTFDTSEESEAFCLRICDALMEVFGCSRDKAIWLVNQYWKDAKSIEDDPLLYHESAYYYAMCIGHHPVLGDGEKIWWKNAKYWPPPPGWEV